MSEKGREARADGTCGWGNWGGRAVNGLPPWKCNEWPLGSLLRGAPAFTQPPLHAPRQGETKSRRRNATCVATAAGAITLCTGPPGSCAPPASCGYTRGGRPCYVLGTAPLAAPAVYQRGRSREASRSRGGKLSRGRRSSPSLLGGGGRGSRAQVSRGMRWDQGANESPRGESELPSQAKQVLQGSCAAGWRCA